MVRLLYFLNGRQAITTTQPKSPVIRQYLRFISLESATKERWPDTLRLQTVQTELHRIKQHIHSSKNSVC
jgi:hypothetical protein